MDVKIIIKDTHNTKICSNDLSLIGCNVTLGKGVKVGKLSMITKNIKGGKQDA